MAPRLVYDKALEGVPVVVRVRLVLKAFDAHAPDRDIRKVARREVESRLGDGWNGERVLGYDYEVGDVEVDRA